MKFQRLFLPIVLALALSLSGGCALVRSLRGSATHKEENARNKIVNSQNAIAANNENKIQQISNLSFGADFALDKVTNPEPAIVVAKEMNDRVLSLTGLPPLEEQKTMLVMINDLLSTNINLIRLGEVQLSAKDKEITALQIETKILLANKDNAINKYITLAQSASQETDYADAQLKEYTGFWGLSGVFKSSWNFIKHIAWTLAIGGVLFLILRLLSTTNPIASAIFSVFDTMFAWIINCIKVIAPKAMTVANTVSKEAYNDVADVLGKIVDNIESLKEMETRNGTADITLKEVLVELDKSMDGDQKAMVEKIKTELGY